MLTAAAIVLAGGKSTRMGKNKALLEIKEQRMLEGIVSKLTGHFSEIIISANDSAYEDLGIKTVRDIYTDCGPLGGIHAGLRESRHHVNFLIACDMPFVNIELANYMVNVSEGYDAVVPKMGEYYQPLFAVYTKNCLPVIEKKLEQGRNKITSFYHDVKLKFVEVDEIERYGNKETIFFNVNTPADLEAAKVMAGRNENGQEI